MAEGIGKNWGTENVNSVESEKKLIRQIEIFNSVISVLYDLYISKENDREKIVDQIKDNFSRLFTLGQQFADRYPNSDVELVEYLPVNLPFGHYYVENWELEVEKIKLENITKQLESLDLSEDEKIKILKGLLHPQEVSSYELEINSSFTGLKTSGYFTNFIEDFIYFVRERKCFINLEDFYNYMKGLDRGWNNRLSHNTLDLFILRFIGGYDIRMSRDIGYGYEDMIEYVVRHDGIYIFGEKIPDCFYPDNFITSLKVVSNIKNTPRGYDNCIFYHKNFPIYKDGRLVSHLVQVASDNRDLPDENLPLEIDGSNILTYMKRDGELIKFNKVRDIISRSGWVKYGDDWVRCYFDLTGQYSYLVCVNKDTDISVNRLDSIAEDFPKIAVSIGGTAYLGIIVDSEGLPTVYNLYDLSTKDIYQIDGKNVGYISQEDGFSLVVLEGEDGSYDLSQGLCVLPDGKVLKKDGVNVYISAKLPLGYSFTTVKTSSGTYSYLTTNPEDISPKYEIGHINFENGEFEPINKEYSYTFYKSNIIKAGDYTLFINCNLSDQSEKKAFLIGSGGDLVYLDNNIFTEFGERLDLTTFELSNNRAYIQFTYRDDSVGLEIFVTNSDGDVGIKTNRIKNNNIIFTQQDQLNPNIIINFEQFKFQKECLDSQIGNWTPHAMYSYDQPDNYIWRCDAKFIGSIDVDSNQQIIIREIFGIDHTIYITPDTTLNKLIKKMESLIDSIGSNYELR